MADEQMKSWKAWADASDGTGAAVEVIVNAPTWEEAVEEARERLDREHPNYDLIEVGGRRIPPRDSSDV